MDANECKICDVIEGSDLMTKKLKTELKNNSDDDIEEVVDVNEASEVRRICVKLPKKQADEITGIKETLGIEYNRLFEMAVLDPEKYSIYCETAHKLDKLEAGRKGTEKDVVEE